MLHYCRYYLSGAMNNTCVFFLCSNSRKIRARKNHEMHTHFVCDNLEAGIRFMVFFFLLVGGFLLRGILSWWYFLSHFAPNRG